MTTPLMTEDEARELLAGYLGDLRECLEAGWAGWKKYLKDNPQAASHRASTRASIVYDYVVAAAKAKFDGNDDVHVSEARGFLTLTIKQPRIVVLRFKKFASKKLKTSGIPTQQRIEFQNQWVSIDGLDVTNMVVGYLLDKVGSEPIRLAVTCPLGKSVMWAIDLDDDIAGVQPVNQLPLDDAPVVRSKTVKKIEKKDETEGS
jgi:hypothetical protein